MLELIEFKGEYYPNLQTEGFAAQYAFPFAKKILSGVGYDIGCMKEEWAFPGAVPIDLSFDDPFDALNLPEIPREVDYIFSSHCLEHLDSYVSALEYWSKRLKAGGILFLYLPHHAQKYWRPWHNKKHTHALSPQLFNDYFEDTVGEYWSSYFVTPGHDLNHSFYVIATK